MAINAEFGRRARVARAQMDRPLKLDEIAEEVGRRLGRKAPSPQAVGKWLSVGQEPDSFDAVLALAQTLQCDPAWLAFGDSATTHSSISNGEPPKMPALPDPTLDRKLTEQEMARAQRAAELERREQAKTVAAKKKRGGRGRA